MAGYASTKKLNVPDNNLYALAGVEDDIPPTTVNGMPKFVQKKKNAEYTVICNFRTKEDLDEFAALISNKNLTIPGKKIKTIWFPELEYGERGQNNLFCWMDENVEDVISLSEVDEE